MLVVDDCPRRGGTAELVRRLLDELGMNHVPLPVTVVQSQAEAEQRRFSGSPTVLIDGHDPFAEPGARPALACRLYATSTGPTGGPDADTLRAALRAAARSGKVPVQPTQQRADQPPVLPAALHHEGAPGADRVPHPHPR